MLARLGVVILISGPVFVWVESNVSLLHTAKSLYLQSNDDNVTSGHLKITDDVIPVSGYIWNVSKLMMFQLHHGHSRIQGRSGKFNIRS